MTSAPSDPGDSGAADASEAFDALGRLNRLIEEGHVSADALAAITRTGPDTIRSFLAEGGGSGSGMTSRPSAWSQDEGARLALLVVQLTEGLAIGDDERLRGILESLTIECRLSVENLARLTGVDAVDVEAALHDPATLPFETRYALMSRGSYLVNAVNAARSR